MTRSVQMSGSWSTTEYRYLEPSSARLRFVIFALAIICICTLLSIHGERGSFARRCLLRTATHFVLRRHSTLAPSTSPICLAVVVRLLAQLSPWGGGVPRLPGGVLPG
jgi:hypothetical protein